MTGGTLRDLVAVRDNDYRELERRYRALTGTELVTDPLGPATLRPRRLSRSASVLIGAHNCARSLVPTLVALEHSSFNRRHPELLEVIVVDDGSTDETRATLLDLELDLRWRYVGQTRGGLTRAHNTGLSFAEGDVIVFCDADIVPFPRALEELMTRHQALDGVTLLGFRFDIDSADPRLGRSRLPAALAEATPAFWRDFRLSFLGWPANMCRDTGHLRDLGCGRRLRMANGAAYDLPAMVVGAFFSIERAQLLRAGASDERLVGWGCEDSLIGAHSLALGNAIIPVYAAVAWHVWHPRRDDTEPQQFLRNLSTLERIYAEPFRPSPPDLQAFRGRAIEVVEPRRVGRGRSGAGTAPTPVDDLAAGAAHEAVGRFGDALAAYKRVGDDREAALGRARCLRACGNPEAALSAAEHALGCAPGSGEASLALALALADLEGFGEARVLLEQARLRAHPPFEAAWVLDSGAESHKRRGNAHARQDLHLIAATDFALALIADPTYAWAHFDRAQSLRRLGRTAEALRSMRRADDLLHPHDGNRTWVHSALASLHACSGREVMAQVQLEHALSRFPENDEALRVSRSLTEHSDTEAGVAGRS